MVAGRGNYIILTYYIARRCDGVIKTTLIEMRDAASTRVRHLRFGDRRAYAVHVGVADFNFHETETC